MEDPRQTSQRTRSAAALFFGVAASALGYTLMTSTLPLAAEDLLGSARWSGLPSALMTTGVAFGTTWIAGGMARLGRRSALALGYLGAAVAACGAALGVGGGRFALVAVAIFGVGAGFSANRLSRYAAADLYEPARRSGAIGWNVWAATLGAVLGPLLLGAIGRAGESLGAPAAAGPFAVAALAMAAAGMAVHRAYVPVAAPVASAPETVAHGHPGSASGVRLAGAALVLGQVVMVLVMTMTPVHIRHGGHGLSAVGIVFAAHTFGMYALSPLAGAMSDRLGRVPMILTACAVLAGAALLASVSDPGSRALVLALFLLGFGWCLGFVAASALLTESAPAGSRFRLQGGVDSLVFGGAAAAGLASGLLLSTLGYPALGRIGAVLALTPLVFLRRGRLPS
jgi:MFS family permease